MVQVRDTMERLWIIWIVIGYLVNVGDTLLRAQCQREGYFQAVHENHRLRNYVISSTDVQSLLDCVMACMNEERCSSYNFQVSGNPLHKCEVNSRSQSSAEPGSLEPRNGFQYYEEAVHSEEHKVCESGSCFNGGSCEEKCVGFPYYRCQCPKGYTGVYCEKLESGNFLLKFSSNNVDDYSAVFVNRRDFKTFTSCFWMKPNSSEGVVFTYATKRNPVEMAIFFNQSSIIVHLSGVVIVKNLVLPINKWSHLCIKLDNGQRFALYYNNKRVSGIVKITGKVVAINGRGAAVVAGFKQTSPGKIVHSAASNLLLSRLYFWSFQLHVLEMFRLYNEPQVSSMLNKPSFVNWRMFYKPQLPLNTTLIYPADQPLHGNFDLKFSGLQQPVIINFTMVELKLYAFTLCLWVRTTNQADGNEPSLFTFKSGSDTIMKLVSNKDKYDFTLLNVTWRIPYIPANGEWHHFCATWRKKAGVLNIFLNGILQVSKFNVFSHQTLHKISSATVELGGSYFIGEMTNVNVWFKLFEVQFIGVLAMKAGNAMGDLFAWTMLEENEDTRKVSPSVFPKERGDFDMKFPQPKENSVNYIYLESPESIYTGQQFACSFWIKIPLDASPFTLISYAVPSQVNEFNVHFGTNGIWVHINGKKRFISIERQAFVGQWHHFLFNWFGHIGQLNCLHDNRLIREKKIGVGTIQGRDGVLVVGAQQTGYKIISNKEYQFYGQLSQLQFWVRNIQTSLARTFLARCSGIPGNFFSWSDMPVAINGSIGISRSSECLKIKNGEEEE